MPHSPTEPVRTSEPAKAFGEESPGTSTRVPMPRFLPWLLLVGGVLGTVAAFVLTIERIALLTDDTYVPTCSLNPVLNCGSIMRTEQAKVFGFPNPLIGLAGFPVLAATGAALLAGARLRRWYWLGLQAGVSFAAGFVGWLIFQSLYRINALCPYCLVVWVVVIPVFWYVTLTNLTNGHLGSRAKASRATRSLTDYHAVIVTVSFVAVLALITHRFWDYWSGLVR